VYSLNTLGTTASPEDRERRSEVEDRLYEIMIKLDRLIFSLYKPEYQAYEPHLKRLEEAANDIGHVFHAL
jgi:hypothetical protein